jgi:thiol:disulfide interchange protein DsbD
MCGLEKEGKDMFENLSQFLESFLHAGLPASFILAYIVAFFAGVLTSFTPCVYPMIPVLLGFIGAKDVKTKKQGFIISISYAIGISIIYALLGTLAAGFGFMFGVVQTNPIVLFIVANIFIFLGVLSLGLFNIPTLGFGVKKAPTRTGALGAFFLGIASGFVAAPCAAPVFIAILSYIAYTGNIILGSTFAFTFGLGMNTFLVLLGTFAGMAKVLPKSGVWMEKIKKFFGFLLIFIGQYFLIQSGRFLG